MSFVRPNIAAMSGYQPGEQPQAGKFIKLNTNENPYPASPAVAVAIRAALDQGLEKYPDAMATSFRLRAGEVLGVDPDWILCGNGSDDILTIVTRTFVGQDDLLRLPYPSYILYRTLSEIQAARFEEIQFDANWKLGEDFVADRDGLRFCGRRDRKYFGFRRVNRTAGAAPAIICTYQGRCTHDRWFDRKLEASNDCLS